MGEGVSKWLADIDVIWRSTLGSIIAYLPNLAGVILLLLIGWLLARWARAGVQKLGDLINGVLANVLEGTTFSRLHLTNRGLRIAGNAAFWLVILIFVTAAAKIARLDVFSSWLDRVLSYFPVLLAGALIIAAGYVTSIFARDIVTAALRSGGFRQSALLGRVAQVAIFLSAIVIGVDQIGIDVTFLTTVIAISLASLLGGIALAFGFGSRDYVANVLAAQEVRRHYTLGQVVRFGKMSGELLEITPTTVVIATEAGRATIPARTFHRRASVLLTPGEESG